MKLFVGLGNPGDKYTQTRHNVGFMFADYLLDVLNKDSSQQLQTFKQDKLVHAHITKLPQYDTCIITKPQTFMNRSGDSVKKALSTYTIDPINLFVAHDDLDIQLGKFKIQLGVGPKKHNGISSIEDSIQTNEFWRVRIGVDNRDGDRSLSGENYVLQNFTDNEYLVIQQTFPEILQAINTIMKPIQNL